MRSYKPFFFCVFLLGTMAGATGCGMYRAPGAMLPSLAAAAHDRSIEKHAATSGFPSPSDVGLGAEDEEKR